MVIANPFSSHTAYPEQIFPRCYAVFQEIKLRQKQSYFICMPHINYRNSLVWQYDFIKNPLYCSYITVYSSFCNVYAFHSVGAKLRHQHTIFFKDHYKKYAGFNAVIFNPMVVTLVSIHSKELERSVHAGRGDE